MKIDLSEFLEKEDQTIEKEVAIGFDKVTISGIDHDRDSKESVTLTFFNDDGKKLYVSGSTKLCFKASCDRCLLDVSVEIPIKISHEILITDDVFSMENDEGLDYITDDHYLDTDGMIMAEVHLGWPSKILCKDDCLGLCPVCGVNRNLVTCECDTEVRDPRMMQFLDAFNESKKEV